MALQVLIVGWVVATIYFLICYTAPCRALPSGQVLRHPILLQHSCLACHVRLLAARLYVETCTWPWPRQHLCIHVEERG